MTGTLRSMTKTRRPGDLILDRYMPHASEEAREEARDRLRRLALLFIKIGDRLEREGRERDSQNSGSGCTISSTL